MLQVDSKKRDSIINVIREKEALLIKTELGQLLLEPKRSDIIRIRYTQKDQFAEGIGVGICENAVFSDWGYEEKEREICLSTEKLCLRISRSDAAIRYYDKQGKLLLAERDKDPRELEEFDSYRIMEGGEAKVEEIATADGVKKVVRDVQKEFDKKLYHTRLHLKFKEEEYLYGLGQAEEGVLNLRGTTQYLHQANLKIAIPFFLSTEGYGMLWATGSPAVFQDNQYGSYFYTEADPEMDYYFISGENFDHIISGYRYLTGKVAMLPSWAFGFVQSQERYETQKEILEIAAEYRARKIGLDCLVLDWWSWEDGIWGQKTFDLSRFPDVKAMTDALHDEGVSFMISVWPNMSSNCDNYKEFAEKKMLLPACDVYDAFRQDAREVYWKQLEEGLFRYGIDAWWCDSSEPFTPEWARTVKPEPGNMYEEFVKDASLHLPAEVCNAYGVVHAKGMYEGQRGTGSEKRVTNLTRNGYTGQQRYGTILWSGDTSASWDTYRKQIVAGLNFCASGLPYWTLDIGAFFVKRGKPWYWNGEYDGGMEDLGYQELFVRWFQLGAFLPVFRSHGTDVRREMWMVNGPDNCLYKALLTANRLRYRLMPYIYSLAGSVWKEDATMLRMLAFDFASDEKACRIKDQFLFGKSLMICPVTEPMYFGVDSESLQDVARVRQVYLPSGADWYDFYTNEKYVGGQMITAEAPIDRIPVYVKAGSLIPAAWDEEECPDRICPKNAAEALDSDITLLVYPGADAEYEYYEDAGDGYGYEKGEYAVTRMCWDDTNRCLKIGETFSPARWSGKQRKFTGRIVGK